MFGGVLPFAAGVDGAEVAPDGFFERRHQMAAPSATVSPRQS